jgi:uncharacterized protein
MRRPVQLTARTARHLAVTSLIAWSLGALTLTGCTAAPPLKLYTLSEDSATRAASIAAADAPPPHGALVIEVTRVTLPDYVDSRDLVVRHGDILERSDTARWATRLSIAATDLLTAQLAMRRPDAWVTDQPQARSPDYRLWIHVSRLDVTSDGTGTVDATWQIIPRSASAEIIRGRTGFSMSGTVATDQGIAHLEGALLDRLSGEIDISSLH